ncbi:hypothetical protein Hanom_Chr17g01527831 [Helianthus anomalus]
MDLMCWSYRKEVDAKQGCTLSYIYYKDEDDAPEKKQASNVRGSF